MVRASVHFENKREEAREWLWDCLRVGGGGALLQRLKKYVNMNIFFIFSLSR